MFAAYGFRNRSPSRFEVNALINAYQSTSYNSNENASPDSSGSEPKFIKLSARPEGAVLRTEVKLLSDPNNLALRCPVQPSLKQLPGGADHIRRVILVGDPHEQLAVNTFSPRHFPR